VPIDACRPFGVEIPLLFSTSTERSDKKKAQKAITPVFMILFLFFEIRIFCYDDVIKLKKNSKQSCFQNIENSEKTSH